MFTNSSSDRLVGVKHDAEIVAAHRAGRQVFLEFSADETSSSVAAGDFAPNSLVGNVSLDVLGLVNVANALTVVESG